MDENDRLHIKRWLMSLSRNIKKKINQATADARNTLLRKNRYFALESQASGFIVFVGLLKG